MGDQKRCYFSIVKNPRVENSEKQLQRKEDSMELIWLLVGVVAGSAITSIMYWMKRSTGTLRIDHSNPERDLYRFDIYDIKRLSTKKEIVLKIDNNADLSQK